ncbi:MAG: TraC family protein [Patescibacteria group bacterium]|nr:TraC family protein [Patescibacteria group bacterium]
MADKDTKKPTGSTVESAPAKRNSTQSYLDIDHFESGILIMKDGSMRMILSTSAINFELKAEIERNSIIYAYQNFLNSLEFPIQIIVQSRKLDLDEYLETLKKKITETTNELLKVQISDYVDFVQGVINVANIMQKRFYVVVPHYPSNFKKIGGLAQIFSGSQAGVEISDMEVETKYLMQKTETVASGLQSIGIRALQLDTQELIELFYGAYNPDQSTRQKLIDISQLESEIIEAAPEEMGI